MRPVVFLTCVMKLGFGVSVVINEQAKVLVKKGYSVLVGTLDKDEHFHSEYPIVQVKNSLQEVELFLSNIEKPLVVVHTTPFFEMVKYLVTKYEIWVYEHGDPEPRFFNHDQKEREKIKKYKETECYPFASGVISISEFIRHDILFPKSQIIYNGCDHVTDLGSKNIFEMSLLSSDKIKVGTLFRLGDGEAKYKGNGLFKEIVKRSQELNLNIDFFLAGRGTKNDAEEFEQLGVKVQLNLNEDIKIQYLRNLDVFISCSQWEGFNLPLVEAQALGTAALAFDVGAHPEVCPMIFRNVNEILIMLNQFTKNRALLQKVSLDGYRFVRNRFIWERSVEKFIKLWNQNSNLMKPINSNKVLDIKIEHFVQLIRRGKNVFYTEGFLILCIKIYKRLIRKFK